MTRVCVCKWFPLPVAEKKTKNINTNNYNPLLKYFRDMFPIFLADNAASRFSDTIEQERDFHNNAQKRNLIV